MPGNNRLNGQQFAVNVTGYVVTGSGIACPNVTVALYAQTNAASHADGHNPTYTAIATTQADTGGNANAEPFSLSVVLSGDSVSGVVQGVQTSIYNGLIDDTSPVAIENLLSNINFNADVPFGLVVGVTFSVSAADNAATLTQFTLSA